MIIALLLFVFYLALQSPTVQTKLTKKLAESITEEIGAKVTIESVDIDFFETFVLNGVYLEDQNEDILLFVEKIRVNADELLPSENKYYFDKVSLEKPYFYLRRNENAETNIEFLRNYLVSDKEDRKEIDIRIKEVEIQDASFLYLDITAVSKPKNQINFKNILATSIDIVAKDFQIIGKDVLASIDKLSLIEKSGFVINNLETNLGILENEMSFSQSILETPKTMIQFDYKMKFEEGISFKDFTNAISQDANLVESNIHLEDLNFFSSVFNHFDQEVYINGQINGTINDFSFQDLEIRTGSVTSIKTSGSITDVMDKDKMKILADVRKLSTSLSEIERIALMPLNKQGKNIRIPANLRSLGRLDANGQFNGTLKQFETNGYFNSKIGAVIGNVLFKNVGGKKGIEYSGFVETENFDAGKILQISEMGPVNLKGDIQGSGSSLAELRSQLSAEIYSITYRDHNYQNIEVNGNLARKKFSGEFSIDEEKIALDFTGNLDFTKKNPLLDFEADIENLDLAGLNFLSLEDSTHLSGKIKANLVGLEIDQSLGEIIFQDLVYQTTNVRSVFGNGNLNLSLEDSIRFINLNSDILDVDLSGYFKIKNLDEVAFSILTHHLPSVYSKRDTSIQDLTFLDFDIALKNVDPLTQLFVPELDFADDSKVFGEFNNYENKFDFVVEADTLSIGKVQFLNLFSEGVQNYYQGYFTGEIDQINFNNQFSINDVWLTNAAYRDTLETDVTWYDKKFESNGSFSLMTQIESWEKQLIKILPSEIAIGKNYWHIDQVSEILRDSSAFRIDSLMLKDKSEFLLVDGIISHDPEDELDIEINEFDLAKINSLISGFLFELEGEVNSELTLRNVYTDFLAEVEGGIKRLSLSGEEIGDLNVNSTWDKLNKRLELDGYLLANGKKEVNLSGTYIPLEEQALNLILTLDHFDLSHLNTIPSKKISEISGNANGLVSVNGNFSKPLLEGELELEQAGVKINYLNTKYLIGDSKRASKNAKLSNKLIVQPDLFGFDLMPIMDQKSDTGYVTASLYHDNFREWNFDVYSEFKEFLLLDTDKNQNPLYYGTAYGTGSINVGGFEKNISISIDAKSDSSTVLNIPIGETGTTTFENFVTFVDKDSVNVKDEQQLDLSGIALDMNFEITENALVNLIFDEKIGDVMSGVGEGNLNLEISPGSDLSIVGRYTVKQGDYLFTLRNSINKRFKVKPGGTITWFGNPYDAELNLEAFYETRTSIYDLVLEDPEQWRRRIPVACNMSLTRSLLNPDIDFSIEFPGLTSSVKGTIESRINTDAEKNKQIFGLLVLNKFFPPQDGLYTSAGGGLNGLGVGTGAESNTFELLSNQLSNWLSQISNDFDIGLNYRPGDAISNEELAVALSTQLFKDRVSLYGNVGFYNDTGLGQRSTNFIGDFILEYSMDKEGKLNLKVFNKTNDFSDTNQSPTTQGVGLLYEIEFD